MSKVLWFLASAFEPSAVRTLPVLNIFLKNGTNSASFCLFSSFSQHNDKYATKFDYKWKKNRWYFWYLNSGPQDGRRRQIHWAMAALSFWTFFEAAATWIKVRETLVVYLSKVSTVSPPTSPSSSSSLPLSSSSIADSNSLTEKRLIQFGPLSCGCGLSCFISTIKPVLASTKKCDRRKGVKAPKKAGKCQRTNHVKEKDTGVFFKCAVLSLFFI